MPSRKYFIAIVIPDPFFTKVEEIKQELFSKHNLKGALRSPSHITLHRPFEWKEEKENLLVEKLNSFIFKESFSISLEGFSFFEPRVIFVNVRPSELMEKLHTNLTDYCKKELRLFNEAEDLRGFHPHVTVAFRDLKKPLFFLLQEQFKNRVFAGNFPYQGFSLLRLDKKWEAIHTFK